jgi:hypothetical protein
MSDLLNAVSRRQCIGTGDFRECAAFGLAQFASHLALGLLPDGTREILGLRIENTEGASFWVKKAHSVTLCPDTLVAP